MCTCSSTRREIDVTKLVSHQLPIEKIDEALQMANERADSARKIAITFP